MKFVGVNIGALTVKIVAIQGEDKFPRVVIHAYHETADNFRPHPIGSLADRIFWRDLDYLINHNLLKFHWKTSSSLVTANWITGRQSVLAVPDQSTQDRWPESPLP
jgi:hypothetical protein